MARQLVMTRPEVISTISHYKPLEHIVSQYGLENIDEQLWARIEETMKQGFITSFIRDEITLPQDAIGWLIIVKDKETLQPLGLAQCSVSQNMPYGSIRINNLACNPDAQRKGLGILMLSALFKLVPNTNRLSTTCTVFLPVLPTLIDDFGFYL